MREIYLEPDHYAALLEALATMKPSNPFAGGIEQSDIMVALGEGANIWPADILEDSARAPKLLRANYQDSRQPQPTAGRELHACGV